MPLFPSKEWCEALAEALHAEPEFAQAGAGWSGAVVIAVLPSPPALCESFAVWADPSGGRIRGMRVLEDLDEVEEVDAPFLVRAPFETWRQLLEGRLDPIEAALHQHVEFRGDLQPIVERARFKGMLKRALARVPTEFPAGRKE